MRCSELQQVTVEYRSLMLALHDCEAGVVVAMLIVCSAISIFYLGSKLILLPAHEGCSVAILDDG